MANTLLEYGANSTPITGRFLAFNKHDRIAHAFYGADLVLGKSRLEDPTILQAAKLCRVNPTYVHWALKRQAERADIELGLIPLVPTPSIVPKAKGTTLTTPSGIDDALVQFVRSVGINRVLEAACAAEAAQ